jgi:hypothetical protein
MSRVSNDVAKQNFATFEMEDYVKNNPLIFIRKMFEKGVKGKTFLEHFYTILDDNGVDEIKVAGKNILKPATRMPDLINLAYQLLDAYPDKVLTTIPYPKLKDSSLSLDAVPLGNCTYFMLYAEHSAFSI